MSRKVPAWALAVIGLEVILLIGVLAWALTHHKQNTAKPMPQAVSQPATTPLAAPKVTPVSFATGLAAPTDIQSAPGDKRLFVTEQAGKIQIISADGSLGTKPLLDITSKVKSGGEMGLLGLAFHPQFASNGYFYTNYIDQNQNTIIARYQVDKGTGLAKPDSEKVLLKIPQPYTNHNGGGLQFGPDGYLYIALGDGGSGGDPENRAQNKNELLGKILRIDVNKGDPYAIPPTNPFASGGGKPEIWAYGLRNPWRLAFDAKTGDLIFGDVGQNKYEELNWQKASSKGGENYGWRCYEGLHDYNTSGCLAASAYVQPVLEYNHDNKRCSITSGFVYRGTVYPALQGKFFYGDFCNGEVYFAEPSGSAWNATPAFDSDYGITTFGQGSNGELYLADAKTGTIYHLTDSANAAQ